MTSATMFHRFKGMIKERVPMARSVVQWMKTPVPSDVVQGPIPRPPWMPADNLRERFSRDFLTGSGLEIGALYNPVFVKPGVEVKYVDWEAGPSLREQLRPIEHLANVPIVEVDIVEHGETLASIHSESQDFIIANHFLEHVQDPIGTIKRHLQLLRPGGILFYGLPDKRFTFDRERPVTTLEHHFRDHEEGPAWSLMEHMIEYVALVENKTGIEGEQRIKDLLALPRLGIHFHVWTIHEMTELFTEMRKRYNMPYVIEAIMCNQPMIESICILRKI
ncbi:MAG: methyltransferase domain-containing protein [Gemmatales bacterium]